MTVELEWGVYNETFNSKIEETCQPASETIVARFFTMKARAADFSLQSKECQTDNSKFHFVQGDDDSNDYDEILLGS